ncbi:MAG: bifunctional metallophosphatase/5'-nucleotidase [Deltaproteobacteria bacterium]|nr:bifunctional metallophosphatase/5'-nucleotidase [Deltaproteobacteria bacterium]
MNINSIILFFVLFQFNLVFANNFQDKSETSALPDQVVDLTIFHTNDIHSHMHAPKSDEFHLGGLARLSTLLKSLREQSPLAITLDAGDWSEGTWYYNIDAGQNMLRILNQIGYDTVVVGNHDYLSGPDLLLGTVKNARVNFKVLAANLDFANYTNAGEFQQSILPYVILEKQGIKIGVIGLTQNGYEYAGYFKPVVVTSPLKEAIKQARALRSKVDVLILLSHNHFILNEQIARLTPGIDAVISGHTHKKISKAVMVWNISGKKVPVVETEAWGKFIGELHFKVDLQNKKVAYESYQLHPVVPTLKEDPVISQMIAEEDQKLKQLAGMDTSQIIGWSEIPLGSHDSREAGLCDLLVKSLQKTTQSEAAIELVSLTGVDLPAGPITVMDAHNVMPHLYNFETKKEWTIKLWKASGRDLGLITKIAYLPNILPLKETGFFLF